MRLCVLLGMLWGFEDELYELSLYDIVTLTSMFANTQMVFSICRGTSSVLELVLC